MVTKPDVDSMTFFPLSDGTVALIATEEKFSSDPRNVQNAQQLTMYARNFTERCQWFYTESNVETKLDDDGEIDLRQARFPADRLFFSCVFSFGETRPAHSARSRRIRSHA
jgi:hypothetical protein